jgi:Patatin-like phospholipase
MMGDEKHSGQPPKSLADVLAEELDPKLGADHTQKLSKDEKQKRLKDVYERIHKEQPTRSALCLSGGGIRSATFGLGILQGLAKHDLLHNFDYLSTVSGGGYVGGWLTAWIKNHPGGVKAVAEELKCRLECTLNPEPQEIRHLRAFGNYLTPKTGLMSADTWTLIATFVRNMFLNWLVLISWLAAALMIPRLYLASISVEPDWGEWIGFVPHRWDIGLTIVLALGLALIAIAMAYAIIDVPSTGNARLPQSRFLKFRELPLLLASLILAGWWAVFRNVHGSEPFQPREWLLKFVAFSVASYLSGGVLATVILSGFRKPEQKARPGRFIDSFLRTGTIVLTAAFAGVCLWAIATRVFLVPAGNALNYVSFAPALFLAVLLLVNFLFTGLASRITGDEDREWWGRSAAWIVITMFSWIAFNMIALWGAQAITPTTTGNRLQVFLGQPEVTGYFKAILGAFGGVTGIVAGLLALRRKLGQKRGFQWLLVIVTVVFFVLLSIVISWVIVLIRTGPWMQSAAKWFYHESALSSLSLPAWRVELFISLFLMSVLLFFGIVMGFFIDANKFSLHAIYRNRLIRAYLAASDKKRSPNKFTGFDPGDDFELCELKSEKPFHLINATLNVIKSKELAWQERKAESFTMSRLHCGSWHVGYRSSAEYGDGITLGTALAISGAAANPNMGYYSSPVVGFLMTLFNVRLGWWLGNPGPCGDKTWRRAGPGYAVGPLFSEAIGNTTDRSKYVNLSDGGHFENLGLYEMVLRRCKLILVVDAAQDSEYVFADLGNAIRKIRIDLGIPIDIRVVSPKKSKGTVNHCAFGTIKYSAMDGRGTDGSLIYVKPLVSGDEPPDVSNYTAAHPEFPHETTTDQWFSESQFESYRLLGEHAVETICGKDWKPKELPRFFEQVKRDLAQ